MAEKVFPIVRPAHFSFLASLKEMLGAESYFIKKMEKVGIQSSGLRISFSSLFAREMLGVRIPPLYLI